jgi:ABC-type transport system involved in cytochrome c biogenesis permease component
MTFLPIVERELRVSSRRRGTYWNRAASALVAILVCAWLFMVSTNEPIKELGKILFSVVSGIFFVASLLGGVRYTADSLSEEKREGTLGLLFLTDLRGYDVVLGKLAATSVNALYGLLAIFPVMAIPLLLGGVSVGEFWRMTLVLTNTLFLSLAAGLFTSSVSRSARKAMAGTLLLILLINGAPPVLGVYYSYRSNANTVEEAFLIPSAGYAFAQAFDALFIAKPERFVSSVATSHGLSWVFLALASIAARNSWQDRPAGARRVRWRERWQQWSFGNATERMAFRTRLLNTSPCFWLGGRDRLKPMLVWGFIGLTGALWFWGYLKWPDDWPSDATYIITAITLHTALKLWVTSEACQRLGPDYRSGALELLLSTPLTVREILRGQFLSLQRQFLWPAIFIVVVDFAFLIAGMRGVSASGESIWVWLCLAGISVFMADLVTLCWVGLWLGLTAKHANRATGATVARVLVLPWVEFAGILLLLSFSNFSNRIDDWSAFCLGLWFVASVVTDVAFFLWSRHRLLHDLRTFATHRYMPGRSLLRWRPVSRTTPTTGTTPAVARGT